MCILFVKIFRTPAAGQYKLILATNRDEFFARPSRQAHFWTEDENIIGGKDMTEKKEGGTWLAMSKKGRMGIVLNLSGSQPDPQKLGRGFLIPDYLKTECTTIEHLENLKKDGQKYNKFHLVTIEFIKEPVLSHYSNGDESDSITSLMDGTFAVGNSPLTKPYQKVKNGKTLFEDIVRKHNNSQDQKKLVEELLGLLKWEEKHIDPSGKEMSHLPVAFREKCSSVFIDNSSGVYGTRTHTIILVDSNGTIDFYEWTLKEPIDVSNEEWLATHEQFQLLENS